MPENRLLLYREVHTDGSLSKKIEEQEQIIELGEKKKQKLLQLAATGNLSDRDFFSMNKQCTAEIEQAQDELRELCEQRDSANDFKKHMDTIRQVLQAAERDASCGVINKDFVDKYIDKIYTTMDDENTMHLQIKIFTGETTDKYLSSLRSRTGHTFKNV